MFERPSTKPTWCHPIPKPPSGAANDHVKIPIRAAPLDDRCLLGTPRSWAERWSFGRQAIGLGGGSRGTAGAAVNMVSAGCTTGHIRVVSVLSRPRCGQMPTSIVPNSGLSGLALFQLRYSS
ncbi:hypothetical protein CGRA01v4_14444 [Colletotrichum graminicola]|nr:hypothetical protein CGRA01v4_14444 [Colletotrichum graminicola]